MNKLEQRTVCYVGSPPLFTKGASAIHIMKMCQAMKRTGIEVELLLPGYDKSRDIFDYYGIADRFPVRTIPFTNLPGRQIIHGIASAFFAWRNRERFDIFLTRNIIFAYLSTKLLGLKTIYDAHHPPVNLFAKYLFRSFKDSKHLVRFSTNTKGLAKIYTSLGLSRDKLVVAHNGVEIEKFDTGDDISTLRQKLSLPDNKTIVCYCGNTYPGRGIENLIEVAERMSGTIFLVVGGLDSDNRYYRNIAASKGLNNFIIRGFVPHRIVAQYLKASDILVIPYTSRMTIKGGTNAAGFTSPIKLFEYLAAGKPVVSTDLPTIREVVKDGEDAIIVKPDSVGSLQEGLNRVIEDRELAKRLSSNASLKARAFTWEKRVERIFQGCNF